MRGTGLLLVAVACATTLPGALSWWRGGCPKGAFRCDGGRCIRNANVCDGRVDCQDQTDERNCDETMKCAKSAYRCDGACHPKDTICDGIKQCYDGRDEKNCPTVTNATLAAGVYFVCNNGAHHNMTARCDGVCQCAIPGCEDEANCAADKCIGGSFWCDSICQDPARRCDLVADCWDGVDEIDCDYNRNATKVLLGNNNL